MAKPSAEPGQKQNDGRRNDGLAVLKMCGNRSTKERRDEKQAEGSRRRNEKGDRAQHLQNGDKRQAITRETSGAHLRDDCGNVRKFCRGAAEERDAGQNDQGVAEDAARFALHFRRALSLRRGTWCRLVRCP